ncbi:MAG: SDR family oxidoreductase [Phycisphaeraceae bacterium]
MIMPRAQQRPGEWKYQPQSLADQRIIVTGGTTGIGRTTALLLLSLGARVCIFGRDERHLEDAREQMDEYRNHLVSLTADQSDEQDIDRVFRTMDDQLGGIDALINNAGLPARSIDQMDPEVYRYIIESNLVGYIACAKRALPRLKQTGQGTIVNIGSMSAKGRAPGEDVYVATKSGLRGFSDSLAKSAAADNIRVTLIEPGSTGSDLDENRPPEQERRMHDAGEMLFSEAIAEATAWCLAQPQHVFVPLLQVQPLGEVSEM